MTGGADGTTLQLTSREAWPLAPEERALIVAVPLTFAGRSKVAAAMPPTVCVVTGETVPIVLVRVTGVPSTAMPPMAFLTVTRTLVVLPQLAVPGKVTETWEAQLVTRLPLTKLVPTRLLPNRLLPVWQPQFGLVTPKVQPQLASNGVEVPKQLQLAVRAELKPLRQPQLAVLPNPVLNPLLPNTLVPKTLLPNTLLPNTLLPKLPLPQPQAPKTVELPKQAQVSSSRAEVPKQPQFVVNTPSQQPAVKVFAQPTVEAPVVPLAVLETPFCRAVTLIKVPTVVQDAFNVRNTVNRALPAGGVIEIAEPLPLTVQVTLHVAVTDAMPLLAVTVIRPSVALAAPSASKDRDTGVPGVMEKTAGLMAPTFASACGGAFAAQKIPIAASRATGSSLSTRRLFIG